MEAAAASNDPAEVEHDDATPKRICVFRALQLGDMICAGPALRALRRRFPNARITLVGLAWAADFTRRIAGCIDEHVEFPGWPGLPERVVDDARLPGFLGAMRARRFDLALQLHGSGGITNALVRAFGAARLVAHRPPKAPLDERSEIDTWPYPEALHEVHRNLHLVGKLGAPVDDDRVTFPLLPSDRLELRERRPDLAGLPPASYVCLHPGARDPSKWWPAACFAAVGDALAEQGWTIVITGNEAEHGLAREVAARMRAPSVNAACGISIGALAALMSRSRLLVSNDTGVAHVAAGLGLPSVVVFLATDPARWAALDTTRHIALRGGNVAPDAVIKHARRLLLHEPVEAVA